MTHTKDSVVSKDSLTYITKGPDEQALREKYHSIITSALELPDLYESSSVKDPRLQVGYEEMAISLYWRSPSSFMTSRSVEQLMQILLEMGEAYKAYLACSDTYTVSVKRDEQGLVRFYVISPDRPFIIRSLAAVFEKLKLDVEILLHPVFQREVKSTSAVYIELEQFAEDRLDELMDLTHKALKDVMWVTADYKPLVGELKEISENLLQTEQTELHEDGEAYRQELVYLLEWLSVKNFLLCGAVRWEVSSQEKPDSDNNLELNPLQDSRLGILREEHPDKPLDLCQQDALFFAQSEKVHGISRLSIRSRVQRPQRLTHLMLKTSHEDKIIVHSLIGLFTIAASQQSCTEVPIIRKRLDRIVKLESVPYASYDYKFIKRALDNMPKELAFNLSVETLRKFISIAIGVHNQNRTRMALFWSKRNRRADVLVAIPKHGFNTKVKLSVLEHLENRFGCREGSSEIYLDHSADPQVRAYIHLPLQESSHFAEHMLDALEQEVAELTRSWSEKLEALFKQSISYPQLHEVLDIFQYGDAFPPEYQAIYPAQKCKEDIEGLLALDQKNPLGISIDSISNLGGDASQCQITIYSKSNTIPTNKSLPIFENMGLSLKSNTIYEVQTKEGYFYYIHRFIASPSKRLTANQDFSSVLDSAIFKNGMIAVLEGRMENDVINNLILGASLPHRAISVLRAYAGYLWQVIKYATRGTIYHTLARSTSQSKLLWKLFQLRFDPDSKEKFTVEKQHEITQEFLESLRSIKNINQDRILRSLLRVILATHRTNFFQERQTLSFKIHSKELDIIPDPKPLYEIYVRSTEFEGVHLRGGKTARGGIRWSERTEDYRNEILGLMKTQMVKNVLIVPTGAKGGFAVRYLPEDPAALRTKVQECYKEFIRAILSVSDNLIEGKAVTPEKVVAHDAADPYLVVAADKGTATFSDIANAIATEEFNFWLGDAFASGGSNGYDHKKYGITAKGAWESVKRHFHNSGYNYHEDPFTAVGIGDMSGDVFGNGLLRSDKFKLLAAFNHIHIFIDPNPEPEASFKERKRLFEMPRSKWSDYNPELISEGGGVYDRFSKEIKLSKAARDSLGIPETAPESFNGEELIRYILQAPVKLLWNGGIGTYVKSSEENNAEVNDGTNDTVRIDADQLRCEIVGEGGNLGFTQRARIEFSRLGGRIFTDAIDNSGGVDLSDHEVNIKLGLSELVKNGQLTQEERNLLLVEIVPEVVEKVLTHNKNHSALLSLGLSRSLKSIHYFQTLLRELERQGYLDRALEDLPTAEDLLERASRKEGLFMPELAVCMAAVKMWIKDRIVNSLLVQDPLLEGYLLDYFPTFLREKYYPTLVKHPLRNEIIATQVTNSLIDAIGITFVLRMCMSHSVRPITVVKCVMAAEVLLGSREVRERLRIFDTSSTNDLYMRLLGTLNSGVRHATSWLIAWHGQDLPLDRMVELYRAPHSSLVLAAESFFPKEKAQEIDKNLRLYQENGLSESISRRLVLFDHIPSCFNILASVRSSQTEAATVGAVYFAIIDGLMLEPLLGVEEKIDTMDKWEHQVLIGACENINKALSRITSSILRTYRDCSPESAKELIEKSPSFASHKTFLEEIQAERPNAMSLSVLARQLANFQVI